MAQAHFKRRARQQKRESLTDSSMVKPLSQQGWLGAAAGHTSAGGPAPPGAKPGPQGPAAQGLPTDSIYVAETSTNRKNWADELGNITYERGAVAADTGFGLEGNLDLSNPYNRASMLQRAFQQSQRGQVTAGAGAGQLYSGATQRGLDEGTHRYQRDYDAQRRAALGMYQGLENRENRAGSSAPTATSPPAPTRSTGPPRRTRCWTPSTPRWCG